MNRCATCRFAAVERDVAYDYDKDPPFDEREIVRHTCVRIIHGNKDTFCPEPSAAEPAMVVDGSGYAARLLVAPTFGCVLHEPSEEPKP